MAEQVDSGSRPEQALGVEAINAYVGRAYLDVRTLFEVRGLDLRRFPNLMMDQKSVNLPCEDAVTNAVNAARPLLAGLTPAERNRIELLLVGTESGLDFAKPISTYVHRWLGLGERCRSFEVKHACYGGTAALQTALGLLSRSAEPAARALVIAADAASVADRNTYWEPSQGAGAVAMLVGREPRVLEVDPGASGFCSYEVMDTLRPRPDLEAGDSDLSLLSYLNCLERSFEMYRERVAAADVVETFDYLVFHTPFAGMVRGAHRQLLRRHGASAEAIERDFQERMLDSLAYCSRVGNVYSAALYLALCSLIDRGSFERPKRIGLFSYGSGCASEFYSGVVAAGGERHPARTGIATALDERCQLTMPEYEVVSDMCVDRMGGVRDHQFTTAAYQDLYERCLAGRDLLVLDRVEDFRREYRWS